MMSLAEKVLDSMKNKSNVEIDVNDHSFSECESIRYKMWDDFKIEIVRENKKLKLLVWRK